MSIPVSGTFSGLYVYPASGTNTLGTTADALLGEIDSLLGAPVLTSLVFFAQPVASNADVTFGPGTVSFIADNGQAVQLSDATSNGGSIVSQGPNAFELSSGGVDYVVSNGALSGAVSLDATLSALATANPGIVAALVNTLKTTVDTAGLGGLLVVPSADLGTGVYQPPCFAAGTLIATPDGDLAVEHLGPGTLVTLATGVTAEIGWVGHRRVTGGADMPIVIRAGALGPCVPRRDLWVSPDHALFVDGYLIPAGLLVNGSSIMRDATRATIVYYHVELDRHGVLLAEGAPAESYLDTGNRRQFGNCPLSYDPIDACACDPRAEVLFAGPRLEAIRARLSRRGHVHADVRASERTASETDAIGARTRALTSCSRAAP